MFDNKQKIMERVMGLPKGTPSPSRRYWCVTCKMLFDLDEPVCPFMPKMCINTPIPVELMPVESSICLEKLGLFYPKIPQKLMGHLADTDAVIEAGALVDAYLGFLNDWGIRYQNEPLQAIKSFIILLSGCETAQRVNENTITFLITDLTRTWKKERLFPLLEQALPLLAKQVGITQPLLLDEMDLMGERPSGRYFCPMCRKFFEFSTQRDSVTCPLMSQKCMATPTAIANSKYTLDDLAHVYDVAPDFYRRFIQALPSADDARSYLEAMLRDDWHLTAGPETLDRLAVLMGI
ncbi:MAG: hypothetical protein ACLQUT_04415 [Thermoleophilia bacterium]